MDNAIGVNVKRDLDLGHASGRGRDANQVKVAQLLVVCGHLAFSLVHLDAHLRRGRGGKMLSDSRKSSQCICC